MKNKRAIVLLSGGLDSSTALYYALDKGYKVQVLIFDYGQCHKREVNSAKSIAQRAKCKYHIIKFELPWGGSTLLTKTPSLSKCTVRNAKRKAQIPPTYVPARNTIFLSFALSFAETIGAEAVFIGANAVDYSVAVNSKVIKKGDGAIPIQKCKIGDYILSMDRKTLRIGWSKVKDLLKHKYISQPMYKIVTEHGRSITVSNGHSLFSLNRRGEIQSVKVEELKKGEYILAPSMLRMFGNVKKINLLDLLSNEQFIFVIHPKLGCLIKKYNNERERWWKRMNVMPLNVYNQFYRKKSEIKDKDIFIKSRKDRGRSIPAILELNKAFCFFLGLWLADGNFKSKSAVSVSCNNTEAIKNLKIICRFFKTQMGVNKNKIDRFINSSLLVKIMKKLGFSGTARKKIIPSFVFNLPLELQSAFLRGFIIGDGSVDNDGPINISLVNESLIDGLQDLLLNFGIVAYKKKQFYEKTNFTDKPFFLYRLIIENSIDKQFFLKHIGNINNKIRPSIDYRSNIRGIPAYEALNDDLKSFKSSPEVTEIKNAIRNNAIYTKNRFDRKLLLKLIRKTSDKALKEKWSSLINNEVLFTRIKKKRKIPYTRNYIYDVSVENNENFICNGLIAHNSGYPDCRPAFIRAFQEVADTGTKSAVEGRRIKISAPLINLSKKEIIKLGLKLGVPFEHTWSCYSGGRLPCAKCDSCLIRKRGFKEAGVKDPLFK